MFQLDAELLFIESQFRVLLLLKTPLFNVDSY